MSEDAVKSNAGQETEAAGTPACKCGATKCPCRWMWVLVVLAVGAAAVYWYLFTRVYRLDVVQTAMQKIAAHDGLRQELGEPIKPFGWRPPSARLEEGERDVRWEVAGPKGHAKAHVFARMMQGKWGIVIMEVELPGNKKFSLADEGGAPRFEGGPPATKQSATNAPPPDIEMPVPTDDRAGK
jgi:hypothetical protein